MIKGLISIFLSLVFLLSGTGFHVDLEYCCGNLESFGLFDHLNLVVEDCCEGEPIHDDCMDEDHVVKEMEAQELISLASFKLEQIPSFDISPVLSCIKYAVFSTTNSLPKSDVHYLPPPDVASLQRFLC